MTKFQPRADTQNKELALKIFRALGAQLKVACRSASVTVAFLAGLISVENSSLDPKRTRFESGVFDALRKVRDGLRANYGSITQDDIDDCDDRALVNLATSWGLCQVMGYHSISTLHCTVADLRNPDKHLMLAVQLLEVVAGKLHKPNLFEIEKFDAALRIWNTGQATGKTFDPYYVQNALAVMEQWNSDEWQVASGQQSEVKGVA